MKSKQKQRQSRKQSTGGNAKWLVLGAVLVLVVVVIYGMQRSPAPAKPLKIVAKETPFNGDRAFADLTKLVGFGPRPAGSDAIAQSRAYIVAELEKVGLKAQLDEFEASTPKGKIKMTNIRATRAGAKPTIIAITGHYDTKRFDFRFDGANDGGSSAAWVLEMARATSGLKLENTLEFIFFDGEEALLDWTDTDSVYGSRYDLDRRYRAGDLKELKALILVDMIGDKTLDIKQESGSTAWLTSTIWSTASALGFDKEFLSQAQAIEDDHIPYLHAGVPAVDIIDFDYDPWHKASDTLDKTSARSLKVVGDVIFSALPEIDKHASQ